MSGEIDVITLAAAHAVGVVVDVSEPEEYLTGHVPDARLVPLGELTQRTGELAHHQRIHVICASGNRSLQAARSLAAAGYDAVSVIGGTRSWVEAGRPLATGAGRSQHD